MPELVGTPSDDAPGILATGRSDITTIFVSMTSRHPQGGDAEYLRWHTFDHRPEQFRLTGLRSSLRLVSTPACRAVRAVSEPRYDSVDHVISYFFADLDALVAGRALTEALYDAGRMADVLPSVERAVYHFEGMEAAPRIKIGADVLPWWPVRGAYILVEQGAAPAGDLVRLPGVGGAWWASLAQVQVDLQPSDAAERLQMTYLFIDEDPIDVAGRLRPALERRWAGRDVVPLLAAPFLPVAGYDFDRYLP